MGLEHGTLQPHTVLPENICTVSLNVFYFHSMMYIMSSLSYFEMCFCLQRTRPGGEQWHSLLAQDACFIFNVIELSSCPNKVAVTF